MRVVPADCKHPLQGLLHLPAHQGTVTHDVRVDVAVQGARVAVTCVGRGVAVPLRGCVLGAFEPVEGAYVHQGPPRREGKCRVPVPGVGVCVGIGARVRKGVEARIVPRAVHHGRRSGGIAAAAASTTSVCGATGRVHARERTFCGRAMKLRVLEVLGGEHVSIVEGVPSVGAHVGL